MVTFKTGLVPFSSVEAGFKPEGRQVVCHGRLVWCNKAAQLSRVNLLAKENMVNFESSL